LLISSSGGFLLDLILYLSTASALFVVEITEPEESTQDDGPRR